jgi:protein-L-isoaspartate(D-aspartate) O-methyltransferase
MKRIGFVVLLGLLTLGIGCGKREPGPPETQGQKTSAAPSPLSSEAAFARQRNQLVDDYMAAGGRHVLPGHAIKDERVLAAMRRVPRHEFVPSDHRKYSYYDTALPIGQEQTISQPSLVARMTELLELKEGDKALEIGTGSGYQAAVLAELTKQLYTIEILKPLADSAAERLKALGYTNVEVRCGDGYLGWPEHAPFNAIIVTCAPDHIPQPLVDQLNIGGRMVIPVGEQEEWQTLVLLVKTKEGMVKKSVEKVRFVPMTGLAQEKKKD